MTIVELQKLINLKEDSGVFEIFRFEDQQPLPVFIYSSQNNLAFACGLDIKIGDITRGMLFNRSSGSAEQPNNRIMIAELVSGDVVEVILHQAHSVCYQFETSFDYVRENVINYMADYHERQRKKAK